MLARMFPKTFLLAVAAVAAFGPSVVWAAGVDGGAVGQVGEAAVIESKGPAKAANSNAVYEALRQALPIGEGVLVKDLTLEREGGTFHFVQGSFYFYGPVNGRVTGAVFEGNGHFDLAVKSASEQKSLAQLTKSGVMAQDFSTLVLRFTDGTAEEIRKGSAGVGGAVPGSAAAELTKVFRKKLNENFSLRLLGDVLPARAGGFFLASFRMGGAFTGKNVLFLVDPEGTADAAPDQVELSTWDDDGAQPWAAYRMQGAAAGDDVSVDRVTDEKLDVSFENSGMMHGSAETTLVSKQDGLQVVQLELYPTLRVSGVFSEAGEPLDFVQEDKDEDAQFAVILPKSVKAGETVRLLTKYEGKGALRHDGDGVYYLMPGARESWYPAGRGGLGDFANFRMTFHLPKGLQIVATGKQVSSDKESGGQRVVWATDSPIPVAGFNLGSFVSKDVKTPAGFDVSAYTNVALPDYAASAGGNGMGSLLGEGQLPNEVSQGSAAIQIYTDYFGKLPYDHVALTEQSACDYGQSWPMLVYLPLCAFWDATEQHEFGLSDFGMGSYWNEVTPHEVAHQWWGQLVGFRSYRDQWMSEGFANFSVSLYLKGTSKNMDAYHSFWNEQKTELLAKNEFGKRGIDVAPLTMGYRVNTSKSGDVAQSLIYNKGAYVLHMLEMMSWTSKYGDGPFKQSMQTFVKENGGKAATTEDFKASFEKTMPPWMNLTRDGKLDWFFDEYVYGTEVPHYTMTSEFTTAEDGTTSVHMKLTQSNVSKSFKILMPVYLQMDKGEPTRLGVMPLFGEVTVDKTIQLGKLPSAAKKLVLNYNNDILSE